MDIAIVYPIHLYLSRTNGMNLLRGLQIVINGSKPCITKIIWLLYRGILTPIGRCFHPTSISESCHRKTYSDNEGISYQSKIILIDDNQPGNIIPQKPPV